MATQPQRAPKTKFTRYLDPTQIGVWKLIRRPPIHQDTVIQGRKRNPGSNAFKEHQFREGVRLRKALQFLTHGRNIFAYHNMRTNQVVYSLTRYLEKNNVLKQLFYHGKKTVPATLRKDMWVPYYSVHFNDSSAGLRVFQLLREFSMQRQLAPPREMITITKEFLDRKRPRDQEEAKKFNEEHEHRVGQLMKPKDRKRVVMDHRATSVADIAAVLEIQANEFKEKEEKEIASEIQEEKEQLLAEKRKLLAEKQREVSESGTADGKEGEEDATEAEKRIIEEATAEAEQAVMERRAASEGENKEAKEEKGGEGEKPKRRLKAAERRRYQAELKKQKHAEECNRRIRDLENALGRRSMPVKIQFPEPENKDQIKILWNDLQDAQFARTWPEFVRHGELDLTRDHVMPSEKPMYENEVLADNDFNEKFI